MNKNNFSHLLLKDHFLEGICYQKYKYIGLEGVIAIYLQLSLDISRNASLRLNLEEVQKVQKLLKTQEGRFSILTSILQKLM